MKRTQPWPHRHTNKLTGNIAACLTIAGPGATNCATGLYDAKEDHASVISLNGTG